MAFNTDIATISQTPALNGPDGTDLPSTLDDAIRYSLSFIAKLRDGVGFTATGIPVSALAYTPVQQGGGGSQLTNPIKIGWSAASKLRVQVDGTDFGATWPIDVSGNAATATTASNANALGGQALATLVSRASAHAFAVYWDGTQVVWTVNGGAQFAYTEWSRVANRPTDLASFGNSPGYQNGAQLSAYAVQRLGAVISLENIGSSGLAVNISGYGLVVWGVTPSDARLKKNIAPTSEDSLAKISRIDFRQFRFRDDVTDAPIDDGRMHRLGVIAQELDEIDPAWVNRSGTWLAPDQQALLYDALHAVKQLGQVVQQQAADIEDLKVRTGAVR